MNRILSLLFIALFGCSADPQTGGEIAVAMSTLNGETSFFYKEKKVFHAASTMKTAVMLELYRMRDSGELSLKDSLLVVNQFNSIVDGSTFSMELAESEEGEVMARLGEKMSLKDLNEAMITTSSNLATNILLNMVKPEQVMKTVSEVGAEGVLVLRGVEDFKAYEKGLSNRTDAHGMMMLMRAVVESPVVSDDSRDAMLRILGRQEFNEMIPVGLPAGTEVAHKTGRITSICHDAAIVFPPLQEPFILVILTKGFENHDQATAAGVAVTKSVYSLYRGEVSASFLEDTIIRLENEGSAD